MTPAEILATVQIYDNALVKQKIEPVRHQNGGRSRISHLEHARWMCTQFVAFSVAGSIDKMQRWLGFIQAILLVYEIFTLEQLKQHNAPNKPSTA